MNRVATSLSALLLLATAAAAHKVPGQEHMLDDGLKLLMPSNSKMRSCSLVPPPGSRASDSRA